MKVPHLAENLGRVDRAWERDADGLLTHTGGNIGKLAFCYAARLLFDAELRGRLLLVHDSFGEWLIPHLTERLAETTAIWSSQPPDELLEATRPTAIVLERAERFLIAQPRPLSAPAVAAG